MSVVIPRDVGPGMGLGRLWAPTPAQSARIAVLAAGVPKTRLEVYTTAPGSMVALRTYGGELAWLEVLPPVPDYLLAWDTGIVLYGGAVRP